MTDEKMIDKDRENKKSQSEQTRDFLQSGIGNNARKDAYPLRIDTTSEDVWRGFCNSHIVLGKDRIDEPITGHGGVGDPESGMVHIVAGHYGANMKEYLPTSELSYTNPSFMFDSSYIYLSQRADIDDYLELTDGTVGRSVDKSAIAIKADDVRIIGERGIKLVTSRYSEDSRREKVIKLKGIDLIAGNDASDLQPIVKGINTREAFKEITQMLDGVIKVLINLATYQMKANSAIAEHQHVTNTPGNATLPLATPIEVACNGANQNYNDHTIASCRRLSKKISDFKETYLEVSGKKYISSKYNHTN